MSRTNAAHASSTDSEAKLRFGAQALMENCNGLLFEFDIADATLAEPKAAEPLLAS